MMTRSIKDSFIDLVIKDKLDDCDNDRLPKVARLSPKTYCHFRLSVAVVIVRGQLFRDGRGRKPQICRWNLDAICCSSSGITISGFGGHIAIAGYRSML